MDIEKRARAVFRQILVFFGTAFFNLSEGVILYLPERYKPTAKAKLTSAKKRAKAVLEKDSLTRVFIENLGYRTMANLVTKIVMFFIVLWLTRVLSPRNFGLYSFTLSVAGLFGIFGGLGVTGALLKKLPEFLSKYEQKKASRWVLGSLLLVLIGALSMFLVMFLASPWLAVTLFRKPFARAAIKLAGGYLLISLLAGFFNNIFAALKRNDMFFKMVIFREIVKTIGIVLLVYLGFSYLGAVYGYMVGFLAYLILSVWYVTTEYPYLFEGKYDSPLHIFTYSKWFLALGISGTVLTMTDVFMIPIFMPMAYVGYYKVALSLVGTIMFLFPVGVITMPLFSESRTRKELDERFRHISKSVFLITLSLAIFVVLLGKPLLAVLYPHTYVINAWLPLVILAFIIPARNIFWLYSQKLIVQGREKAQLLITSSAATLNVILNVLFIPLLGISGAALASLGSLFVGVLIAMLYNSR